MINLDVSAARKLFRRLGDLASKPFKGARGKRQAAALNRVKNLEASGRGGFPPRRPTRRFGNRPARRPPLGGPRSTYWRSFQPFAEDDRVGLRSTLDWAIVHRGGVTAPADRTTVIRAKRISSDGRFAMGHLLRGKFGVFPREETLRRGIRVRSRPNLDPAAKQYQDAVSRQFELEVKRVIG